MATRSSPNRWEPPAAGPRSNGPRSPWARVGLFQRPIPTTPWAHSAPSPFPFMPLLSPPHFLVFSSLPCLVEVVEHHERQRQALIRGSCLCRASSTFPPLPAALSSVSGGGCWRRRTPAQILAIRPVLLPASFDLL